MKSLGARKRRSSASGIGNGHGANGRSSPDSSRSSVEKSFIRSSASGQGLAPCRPLVAARLATSRSGRRQRQDEPRHADGSRIEADIAAVLPSEPPGRGRPSPRPRPADRPESTDRTDARGRRLAGRTSCPRRRTDSVPSVSASTRRLAQPSAGAASIAFLSRLLRASRICTGSTRMPRFGAVSGHAMLTLRSSAKIRRPAATSAMSLATGTSVGRGVQAKREVHQIHQHLVDPLRLADDDCRQRLGELAAEVVSRYRVGDGSSTSNSSAISICFIRYWPWPVMTASGLLISWPAPAANSATAAIFAAWMRSSDTSIRRVGAVGRGLFVVQVVRGPGQRSASPGRPRVGPARRTIRPRTGCVGSRTRSRSAERTPSSRTLPPGRTRPEVEAGFGLLGEQGRDLDERLKAGPAEPFGRRRGSVGPERTPGRDGPRPGQSPGDRPGSGP